MPLPLWIAAFGAAGVLSRYSVDQWLGGRMTPFPVSTFLINALGSFLIGTVYVLASEKAMISRDASVALSVGFLGGFTTFSAYALQCAILLREGNWLTGLVYFSVSPVVALGAAFAGILAARAVV